jgi:predicted HicB family RNase H-like nuclease
MRTNRPKQKTNRRLAEATVAVKLPAEQHTRLKILCANEGISMQSFCQTAIEEAVHKAT